MLERRRRRARRGRGVPLRARRPALVAHRGLRSATASRPGFDGGIHWGPDSKGLDLGWQAFGPRDAREEGWAGTLLVGGGTRKLGTLGDVIESVLHGDAGLTDYQLAFVAGRQWREIAHTYVGARYTLTRWKVQVIPDLPIIYDGAEAQKKLLGTDASGLVHTTGGVLGAALGYRHVFVGAELNLLYTAGKADVLFEERRSRRVRRDAGGLSLRPVLTTATSASCGRPRRASCAFPRTG